jgi:hypothetical protein
MLEWRAGIGDRILICAELSAESAGFQPEGQPDAERTYKHLAEFSRPCEGPMRFKGFMRNAIIDKLNRHMAECPSTESDVVHALVEIRKLLEQADEKGKYGWLNLFCNWAVHPKLDKGKAIDEILQILEGGLARISLVDVGTFNRDWKAGEVLSFDLFRSELSRFCEN